VSLQPLTTGPKPLKLGVEQNESLLFRVLFKATATETYWREGRGDEKKVAAAENPKWKQHNTKTHPSS
jgi:hypothetical protein